MITCDIGIGISLCIYTPFLTKGHPRAKCSTDNFKHFAKFYSTHTTQQAEFI